MSGDTYDVDLSALNVAMGELKGLSVEAQAIRDAYARDHARYEGWNGDNTRPDDFYNQTQPEDEKETGEIDDILASIASFPTSVQTKIMQSIGSISSTHDEVTDWIGKQEHLGDDQGDDSAHGGGKH